MSGYKNKEKRIKRAKKNSECPECFGSGLVWEDAGGGRLRRAYCDCEAGNLRKEQNDMRMDDARYWKERERGWGD